MLLSSLQRRVEVIPRESKQEVNIPTTNLISFDSYRACTERTSGTAFSLWLCMVCSRMCLRLLLRGDSETVPILADHKQIENLSQFLHDWFSNLGPV